MMKIFVMILLTIMTAVLGSEGYDRSTIQFNPKGSILQLEYARTAVSKKGGSVAAACCSDGVIILAKKGMKSKIKKSTREKFHFVDKHICIAVSGLLFESKVLINLAKNECRKYKSIHMQRIPLELLCDHLANTLHVLTRDARFRPLGVSMIVCGVDDVLGCQVYTLDPEGSYAAWKSASIGKDSDKLMPAFAKLYGDQSDSIKNVNSAIPLFIKSFREISMRDTSDSDSTSAYASVIEDDADAGRPLPPSSQYTLEIEVIIFNIY